MNNTRIPVFESTINTVLSKRASPNQNMDLLNQSSIINPVGFLNPLNPVGFLNPLSPVSPLSVYHDVTTNSCDSSSSSSSCSDF